MSNFLEYNVEKEGVKMAVYKLVLRYDGTRYRGWQKQGNTENTIQGILEKALSDILGQPIDAAGSGRTDEGVHARMQVVSFHAKTDLAAGDILRALRGALPSDIGAVSLEEAPPRFHARLSCAGKTYVYRIWNSPEPCVFERRYVYVLPGELDMDAMRNAAALLCGTHDYAAFCSAKRMKHSTVRTVESIEITRQGQEVRITYSGSGFLYNMVRILTGTLIEVGQGKRRPGDMPVILDSLDRQNAGPTAPAKGLFLWEVRY